MRNLFLSLLLFIFSTQVIFSQEKELETNKSPQESEEYYTVKFKKKRKTAKIFLISGVSAIGLGVGFSVLTTPEVGLIAIPLGAISSLVSIPFYIKAHSYKKKAAEASNSFKVSIGTIRQPKSHNLALGLSYSF